jgi:hypothetical protein
VRDFTSGPRFGLRCATEMSIFDSKGALVCGHKVTYSSIEQGRKLPDAQSSLVLDFTNYYRKEMQNAADSATSVFIRFLQ